VRAAARVDAEPLLRALAIVRDEARKARESSSIDLDAFLKVGAKAHFALMWFEADQAGEVEAAQRWLEQLLSGLPSTPPRSPAPPAPPTPAPAN
jgi:hypothetical protein